MVPFYLFGPKCCTYAYYTFNSLRIVYSTEHGVNSFVRWRYRFTPAFFTRVVTFQQSRWDSEKNFGVCKLIAWCTCSLACSLRNPNDFCFMPQNSMTWWIHFRCVYEFPILQSFYRSEIYWLGSSTFPGKPFYGMDVSRNERFRPSQLLFF